MEDMEVTISELQNENKTLQNKCNRLESEKDALDDKNKKLEQQLIELQRRLDEQKSKQEQIIKNDVKVATCDIGCNTHFDGSAESLYPQQKGAVLQSITRNANDNETTALWKIIALCLLYRTCSKISTYPVLKNLPRVYSQMSPQTWKSLLQEVANELPKVKAPQSECLDHWWGPQQKTWNPAKLPIEV